MTRQPSSLLQRHLSGPVQAALQAAHLAVRRVVSEAEAPQVPVVIRFQGHLPPLQRHNWMDLGNLNWHGPPYWHRNGDGGKIKLRLRWTTYIHTYMYVYIYIRTFIEIIIWYGYIFVYICIHGDNVAISNNYTLILPRYAMWCNVDEYMACWLRPVPWQPSCRFLSRENVIQPNMSSYVKFTYLQY